jgi:hypothetical protein
MHARWSTTNTYGCSIGSALTSQPSPHLCASREKLPMAWFIHSFHVQTEKEGGGNKRRIHWLPARRSIISVTRSRPSSPLLSSRSHTTHVLARPLSVFTDKVGRFQFFQRIERVCFNPSLVSSLLCWYGRMRWIIPRIGDVASVKTNAPWVKEINPKS